MATEIIQGFELSPQQKRLWTLQRGGEDPRFGHAAVLIEGDLDRRRLEAALADLVERYEIFRTRFERTPGLALPLQVIDPPAPPALSTHDLREMDDELQGALWRSLLRELQSSGPGGGREPQLRAFLAALGADRHLLLLSVPALQADLATLERLPGEMAAAYHRAGGRGSHLGDVEAPLQYADLAQWQNDLLAADGAGGAGYWRPFQEALRDGGSLPFEIRASASAALPFALAVAVLPAAAAEAVLELAGRPGLSPAAVLLASWQVLLWRLGAGDAVVVGALFDGRGQEDLRTALGPLSRLLPVPLVFDPAETFAALAGRVETLLLAHREWQDHYPLWREEAEGEPPTFTFAFEHRNRAGSEPPGALAPAEPLFALLEADARSEPFKLALIAAQERGALRLELLYAPASFERAAIAALLDRLAALVEGAAARPATRIDELPLLDAAARHRIVRELNDTAAAGGGVPLLYGDFAAQARRAPAAIALEHEGSTLTYGELDDLSSRLAAELRRLGAGPERRVGVALEPSPEMVIALLAVLRSGAAYLPLDPVYPEERLALMVRDAEVAVVVTREALAGRIGLFAGSTLLLESGWAESLAAPLEPLPEADPDAAAYVIFTSGSTGNPKGTVVSHRAIHNRLRWMISTFGFAGDDRFLFKTPFSFDASIWELFIPLWLGAPLVVSRAGGHQDPAYLLSLVAERRVTILQTVPSLLGLLLDDGGLASCGALRYLFSGGELLPAEYRRRVFATTHAVLVNLYGPTEAAIDATSWDCRREGSGSAVPIGRPIDNDQVYVVDRAGNLVPSGVPGELRIGGRGLARGYLRQPALTAERFLPDPFGGELGGRLYRTGDLARQLRDGEIEVLGRIDHQVKLRGLRIELGEIEAVLGRHPAVRQTVVAVREDAPGERRLVAYLVADPAALPALEELRLYLSSRLPEYMVPAVFVTLPDLPRLPNGKVDRRSLPAPDGVRPQLRKKYVAPENEAQRRLAEIWSAVLGLGEVGVEDNFFELGGDSILSIQVVSRARQAGLRITPRQLFQHQTIAELAAVAIATGAAPAESDAAEERTGPLPLSPIQLDFFARRLEEPHHYNQATLLTVRRVLPAAACEALFAELLLRHPALRHRFRRQGESWLQEVAPAGGPVPFGEVDLSALPANRRRQAVEEASAAAQASLDLATGPLLRALSFRYGDGGEGEEGRLLLAVHHLAIDGVSWRILLDDLQRAWSGQLTGAPMPPAARTASFASWSERLAGWAPEVRDDLEVWAAEMRGAAPVPVDLPESPLANLESGSDLVSTVFEPEETRRLATAFQEVQRAGVREVLLAALSDALGGWSGGAPLLVDLEGHGREEIFPDLDLSRTVGWFTSVFPLRLGEGPARPPVAAVRAMRERLLRLPHEGLSFGVLCHLDPESAARLRALPQAQIGFNYLGQIDGVLDPQSPFGPAAESAGPGQSPRQNRRYLLEVTALIAEGRLVVSWSFSRGVHRRETVERLAERLRGWLLRLLAESAPERGSEAGALRPAPGDFPLAAPLGTAALDRILRSGPAEDLYPLSPLQQGLLFEVLRSPAGGAYVQQVSCRFRGSLDEGLFARAWQQIADRHAILRSGFAWEDLEQPLQVVRPSVVLPFTGLDWRSVPAAELEAGLEELRRRDRETGFDVSRAPLMRLVLVRLAEESYELLWTSHHLVLDGWSVPLIVAELVQIYDALRTGREPATGPAIPYRRYIEWLLRQRLDLAESYWRATLRGFPRATPIAGPRGNDDARPDPRQRTLQVAEPLTARLKTLAQGRRLTLNTLILGVWSLLLSRLSGQRDLVFGIVVSGRPADLAASDAIVGMFVNTLPFRVRVDPVRPLAAWLGELQAEQAEARQYEHSPLAEVRRWSEIPAGGPLFESTFAFNNYPTTDALSREGSAFGLDEVRWSEQSGYPLDFTLGMGARLAVRLMYDVRRIEVSQVERLATGFEALLAAVADRPDGTVGDLIAALETDGSRPRVDKGGTAVNESPMFKKVKPKAVSLSTSEVVTRRNLDPGQLLPLVVEPQAPDLDLADWAASHRSEVEADLVRHGAILFRGFGIDAPPVFERFAASVVGELFNENGEHPRESVTGNVYTPVFYPAEKQLLWHNENSFNHRWPSKILFCCVVPAEQGGETPVVDSRRVFDGIDPEVRAPFVEKGILYVRNYGTGVGLDWRTVFRAESRAAVEAHCRENRLEWEWKEGEGLRTIARRPAVIAHPATGEMSWFNQAQHWHVSCLDAETRDSVRSLFEEKDLPRNCYYGDGTSIPDAHMAHILEVYRGLEVCFPWQRGDVMLVDNVLAAHGRNEYVGRRKLLVALGDMLAFSE